MTSLSLHCPAKLNLALSVGAPDAATGMHPIASWMVTLAFGDDLSIGRSTDGESHFHIEFADDAQQVDWPLEKDLAYRAHAMLEERVQGNLPIDARLIKRIPAGAGLGGGSSNSAAMLLAVNQLFDLKLTPDGLTDIAMQLGSDVGFLVSRQSAALVTGFGGTIEPAPARQSVHLTLIFPGFGSATGAVYGAFDDSCSEDAAADARRVSELMHADPIDGEALFNDLAEPACSVAPQLGVARSHIAACLGRTVHITGSGSTLFVMADDAADAAAMARQVELEFGLPAAATQTLTDAL